METPSAAADMEDVDAALQMANELFGALHCGQDDVYSVQGDVQMWKASTVVFLKRHLKGGFRRRFERIVTEGLEIEDILGEVASYIESVQEMLKQRKELEQERKEKEKEREEKEQERKEKEKEREEKEQERKEKEKEREEKEQERKEKEKEREEKEYFLKKNISNALDSALSSIADFSSSSTTVEASAQMGDPNPLRRYECNKDTARYADILRGQGTVAELDSILSKIGAPKLRDNDVSGLRTVVAQICAGDLFKPDVFGGTANEVDFQAWYNNLLSEILPKLGACRMYSRKPTAGAKGREMGVRGMERMRKVDSAIHGPREDAPLMPVVGTQSWIPTELKPLSRVKENYSTLELEGRRQALSFAGKMLKAAVVECGALEAWALSMSVNILGVELHMLEAAVAADGFSAELRSYIGERQPLLPAGVALDIWNQSTRTERNMANVNFIDNRLKNAFRQETQCMCSRHSDEFDRLDKAAVEENRSGGKKKEQKSTCIGYRGRISLAAHQCGDCNVPLPGGLVLLLRILRADGAICSPFWEKLAGSGVLGRFLGIGASAAVFCNGPEPASEAVKIFLHADADRVNKEHQIMETLANVSVSIRHDCRISRFIRRTSIQFSDGKDRPAFVMTPVGVPLSTRVRHASEGDWNEIARIVCTDVTTTLKHVHSAGIVHMDIRPENIVMVREADGDEHAYLIDWGLALRIGEESGFRGSEAYASDAMMTALATMKPVAVDGSMDRESLEKTLLSVLHGGILPRNIAARLPLEFAVT